jgi:hypothetical protein
MEERSFTKFVPFALVIALVAFGIAQLLRRQRKPRSFREDPIGALKDHSEIVANRAQEATEEALARLQESLDEIRDRMPELNRRRFQKGRKELNGRIAELTGQAQDVLKELRASSIFNR